VYITCPLRISRRFGLSRPLIVCSCLIIYAHNLDSRCSLLESLWDKEFQSQEISLSELASVAPREEVVQQPAPPSVGEADDLARTAGLLVETIKDEQNPKFQNSQFMGLMRQLRDRQAVVEGNTIVERDPSSSGWASEFSTAVKGKGRAMEPLPDQMSTSYASSQLYHSTNPAAAQMLTSNGPILESVRQALHEHEEQEVGHLEEGQKEDPNDAYFRQDNTDYAQYWHNIEVGLAPPVTTTSSSLSDTAAWDQMQQQWDQFEATTVGIKPVQLYQFHPNNPYLLGQSSSTHHHSMHLDRVQAANEVRVSQAFVYPSPLLTRGHCRACWS
jgi:peroxin-5